MGIVLLIIFAKIGNYFITCKIYLCDSIITAKAGVTKSFAEKSIVVGIPAVPRKEFIKQLKIMKDAGDIIAKFKKYEPLLKTFLEEHDSEA